MLHLHFRTSSLQQTIPYHSLLGHQLYRQPISFLLIIPGTAYELCRSIRLHRRNRLKVVQVSANWCLIYDALEENFPIHITISNYDFLFSVSRACRLLVQYLTDTQCHFMLTASVHFPFPEYSINREWIEIHMWTFIA